MLGSEFLVEFKEGLLPLSIFSKFATAYTGRVF